MIKQQSNVDLIAVPKRYDKDTVSLFLGYIDSNSTVILAVDSMAARKFITINVVYRNLVDARMAIEFLTVISFKNLLSEAFTTHGNLNLYKQTLFSDENAVQEACTNKAISYTSFIAGGLVSKAVLDLHKNKSQNLVTVNFDINNFDMVRL